MKKNLEYAFYYVIIPALIYWFLDSVFDPNWVGSPGSWRHAAATKLHSYLQPLAKFVVVTSIISFTVWGFVSRFIVPVITEILEDIIVPVWDRGFSEIGSRVGAVLQEKNFELRLQHSSVRDASSYFTNQAVKSTRPDGASDGAREIEEKATELILGHDSDAAVALLESKADSRELKETLLAAYASSNKRAYWEKAESLLPEFGSPRHYSKLALNYWNIGNIDKAISLTSVALDAMGDSISNENKDFARSCRNTLAYYYADRGRQDDELRARELIASVVQEREARKDIDARGYWNAMDTRGYVRITYGDKDEINEGIRDCENASQHGIDEFLRNRHFARAYSRLAALSS